MFMRILPTNIPIYNTPSLQLPIVNDMGDHVQSLHLAGKNR